MCFRWWKCLCLWSWSSVYVGCPTTSTLSTPTTTLPLPGRSRFNPDNGYTAGYPVIFITSVLAYHVYFIYSYHNPTITRWVPVPAILILYWLLYCLFFFTCASIQIINVDNILILNVGLRYWINLNHSFAYLLWWGGRKAKNVCNISKKKCDKNIWYIFGNRIKQMP